MDITLLNASLFNIPSSHRADVLVHDGPRDLRLWRPPGPDRDLWEAYGDDLQEVLDKERATLSEGELDPGDVVRLHPGKLHCDFLLLCGTRDPHGDAQQSNAPDDAMIEAAARHALEFAGQRAVARVAFPALGGGPGALETPARMAAVVRAAHAYKQACFNEGRPAGIEEVVVCDASGSAVSRTKHLVARLARTAAAPKPAAASPAKPRAARAPRTGGTRTRQPALDAGELAQARASAAAYDRTRLYAEGEWFMHPKFGAGQVREVDPEGRVKVLFEDGKERTMLHGR